ncbi:hypothetical protein LTR85_004581 [Meristemomyces frigidus]|nr:hypothetical protein LTR85_004581 [Meristemomyces frigidus]
MAHIAANTQTHDHLNQWAGARPLHTVSFFFWRTGTPIQKSVLGLLRSLLYQILHDVPDLVDNLITQHALTVGRIPAWTDRKLGTILKEALFAAHDRRFCFFIDGLDEYEGDYTVLLGIISNISALDNVKCCISSRPEVQFSTAFADTARLKMEDLNGPDIEMFVDSKLARHGLQKLNIRWKIYRGAEGVFLWAVLAVMSVVRGVECGDDESVLEQRLDELPSELESLFQHMLSGVEKVHKRSLLTTILTLRQVKERPFSVATLAAMTYPGHIGLYREFIDHCRQTEKRVVAQSRGLLGVTFDQLVMYDLADQFSVPQDAFGPIPANPRCSIYNAILPRGARSTVGQSPEVLDMEKYASSRISWIHRSAGEFLSTADIDSVLGIVDAPSSSKLRIAEVESAARVHLARPVVATFRLSYSHVGNMYAGPLVGDVFENRNELGHKSYELLDDIRYMVRHITMEQVPSTLFYKFDETPASLEFRITTADQWFWCTFSHRTSWWQYIQHCEIDTLEPANAMYDMASRVDACCYGLDLDPNYYINRKTVFIDNDLVNILQSGRSTYMIKLLEMLVEQQRESGHGTRCPISTSVLTRDRHVSSVSWRPNAEDATQKDFIQGAVHSIVSAWWKWSCYLKLVVEASVFLAGRTAVCDECGIIIHNMATAEHHLVESDHESFTLTEQEEKQKLEEMMVRLHIVGLFRAVLDYWDVYLGTGTLYRGYVEGALEIPEDPYSFPRCPIFLEASCGALQTPGMSWKSTISDAHRRYKLKAGVETLCRYRLCFRARRRSGREPERIEYIPKRCEWDKSRVAAVLEVSSSFVEWLFLTPHPQLLRQEQDCIGDGEDILYLLADDEVRNALIADVWANKDGRLGAWEQLYILACIRTCWRRDWLEPEWHEYGEETEDGEDVEVGDDGEDGEDGEADPAGEDPGS